MAEETKGTSFSEGEEEKDDLVSRALRFLDRHYGYQVLSDRMLQRIEAFKGLITYLPQVHVYPYAGNQIATPQEARDEFKQRLPVFVGGRVNEGGFQRWLGRDDGWQTYGQGTGFARWGNRTGDFRKVDIENVSARAVLMADVHFLPSHSAQRSPLPLLRVVHAFGLNFESSETRDYRHVQGQTQSDATDFIDKTNREMWAAVLRAAVEGVPDDVPVHVRIPAIGLGEYKRNLRPDLTEEKLIKSYVKTLRGEVAKARAKRQNLSASLCILGELYTALQKAGVAEDTPGSGFEVLENCNLFDVPEEPTIDEVDGKTMRAVKVREGKLGMLAVVNAWDTNSWIGNGMVIDHTVDGFFVADAGNRNDKLQNTSFLMNVTMIQGDLGQIKVHAQEVVTRNGGKEMADSSAAAAQAGAGAGSGDAEDDLPPPPPPPPQEEEESATVEQALRAVLENYYEIPKNDVGTLFRVIREAKDEDGCVLHTLLADILIRVGVFTMGGQEHGSAKWLDVFAHLAQRVMRDPAAFSKDTCPETVARLLGCDVGLQLGQSKAAENMLCEPFLRVNVKEADMGALVQRDMAFKRVDAENVPQQRALLEALASELNIQNKVDE
jgi:hypothetical protein